MEEKQLVKEAIDTKDIKTITRLSKSPYINVRAAIAQNRYTPREIVDLLAKDPVANVVYVALNNGKCSVNREMNKNDINHNCVICKKDRLTMIDNCVNCKLEKNK